MENFRRKWNLDHITVTEILKFRTNWCRKWRKTFKIEKFVVLVEYFEQQTDCNNYRRKISQSRRVLHGGISHIYLSLSNKWKPCHGAINCWSGNLRTVLEKYLRFQWNCKQLHIEARNCMGTCEIYFQIFPETIHTILKIFSQHDLRKCR